MLRKNSIVKFVLIAILAVIGILLCVMPFNVPGSSDRYNSLVGSIEKSFELKGGVSAIYYANETDASEKIDENIGKLQSLINKQGISNYALYKQGENKIRFDLAGARESDSIFSYIEDNKSFELTLEKISDTLTETKVYLTSEDIDFAYYDYDYTAGAEGVRINFTSKGTEKINALKEDADILSLTTAYMYVDGLESGNLYAQMEVEDLSKSIFTTPASDGAYSSATGSSLAVVAYSITSDALGVDLFLEEASYITPVFGAQTLMLLGISCTIIAILAFAFMWARYGELGLIAILSLSFFVVLEVFFMQAIPGIVLNLAGVIGAVLGFLLAVGSHIVLFEKIRKEYAIGKKVYIACKGGFKGSLWNILDTHFMLAFAGFAIWIIAPASLKCFAICLLLGTLVSVFVVEALTRYFVKIYLPINATNAKKLHLYREANVIEIKEEEVVSQPNSIEEGGAINE